MKCYHMTSLDRVESIYDMGLVPRNENNSKLIKDEKTKVFFSEGYTGAIALYVDFDIVYNNIKNGLMELDNIDLKNNILNSNNLEEYLEDGIYLCFELGNIKNERNFENGCTSKIIPPELLKVVTLKNLKTGEIIYSRFEIIYYMMSKTNIEDILYYGTTYENSPNEEVATKRIQDKVRKYYKDNFERINKFKNNSYELIEISLYEFIKLYLSRSNKYMSKQVK